MIIVFYFLLSLFFGVFYVFMTTRPEIKIKNPDPKNIKDILYIDDNNVCYKYHSNLVECPSDEEKFKEVLKYYS